MRNILVQAMTSSALTLCRDAGVEGAKADAEQFGNPLLRDDDEEGDDGKDGDAARKK